MGNSQLQCQKFNEVNWNRITKFNEEVQIFQNSRNKNIHIEQHHIETISEQHFEKIRELAYLRKNHPRWVSALYFEDNQSGGGIFCASKYQADLYLESIPIKLTTLKSIPFPDALHLYDQALIGYFQLSKVVGYFLVKGDFIGINQSGVTKVWAGPRWEEVDINSSNIGEADMVRSIVNCLDESIDRSSLPLGNHISTFLYLSATNIDFETALRQFRKYTMTYNQGSITARINYIQDNSFAYSNQNSKVRQISQEQIVSSASPFQGFNPQYAVVNPPPQQIIYREQPVEAIQNYTLRRANSFSTFAAPSAQPVLVNHQQIRTIGNGPAVYRPQLNRSLSNPLLISENHFRPPINPVAENKNVAIYKNFGYPVQQVRPVITNSLIVNFVQQGSRVESKHQPNKSLTSIKQQELVLYPPSQTEIPRGLSFQQINTSSRKQLNQRGNAEPQAQSIIMQLAKSQTNTFNQYPIQPKYQEGQNFTFKRDYPTAILSGSQKSFKGPPTNQYDKQFFTPISLNKKEISNLNSIEQVHTEHYQKENSSKKSEVKQEFDSSPNPYSIDNIKENYYKIQNKQLTFNSNKYGIINQNDGKSSEDFLQKLKSFNISTLDNPSLTSYEYNSKKYDDYGSVTAYGYGSTDLIKNYSFEKKKEFDFFDAFHTESIVKESSYEDYKQNEFKPTNQSSLYQNGYNSPSQQLNFETKYVYGSSSNYNAGIDPQIWADIKKNQQ